MGIENIEHSLKKKLQQLGFKYEKGFDHSVFHTDRYKLYDMTIDLDYVGDKLISYDLTVEQPINMIDFTLDDMEALVKLIKKESDGN